MAGLRMLKEIKYALVFHKPRHESKRTFVILHTIFPRCVGGREGIAIGREAKISKDGFEYLWHGLVLKNPAVCGHREEPEPGIHLSIVRRQRPLTPRLHETSDHTVQIARRPITQAKA